MHIEIPSIIKLSLLVLLTIFAPSAFAIDAADLDDKKTPEACTKEFLNISYMLDNYRDKGVPIDEVLQFSKTLKPDDQIPADVIRLSYEYKSLDKHILGFYFLNMCHARAYNVPVTPLSRMADDLQACFRKPEDKFCGRVMHNRILGLPDDFVPKLMRSAPVRTTPATEFQQKTGEAVSSPIAPAVARTTTAFVPERSLPSRSAQLKNLSSCRPIYPVEALKNEWEGPVVMEFLVNPEGDVTDSRVIKSSGYQILDDTAVQGFSRCKFLPGLLNGAPAETRVKLTWVWKLD